MFTILHVSDVHFGQSDERGEQSPITGALVKAGASVRATALVGSHATRYRVGAGAKPVTAKR